MGQMADHASVADDGGESWPGVDDRSVLYGCPGPDGDGSEVAAQHRGRPNGRLGPDGDVADDHRLGVDVRVGVDGGDEVSESVDGHRVTLRHARLFGTVPWPDLADQPARPRRLAGGQRLEASEDGASVAVG